ncbi:hypothetical protein MMC28_000676 [Mycoblastus sanguinarius]|nr:hypothetical protein [Mycoblastus sanguinarius]
MANITGNLTRQIIHVTNRLRAVFLYQEDHRAALQRVVESQIQLNARVESLEATNNIMATFTAKELGLMSALINNFNDPSIISQNVNWEKVAQNAGYQDERNARVMWSRLFKNKIAKAASGANGNGEGAATPSAPVNETTSANKKRGRKTKNTAATDYDDDEEAAAPIKSTKRKCTAVAKSIEKDAKRIKTSSAEDEEAAAARKMEEYGNLPFLSYCRG